MALLSILWMWLSEPSTWISIVLAGLTLYVVRFIQKVRQFPPGPFALPFVGNLIQLKFSKTLYEQAIDWSKKYGDPFTFWLGTQPVVVASTKESFKDIAGPLRNLLAGRMQTKLTDFSLRGNTGVAFSDFSPAWDVLRRLVHVANRQFAKTDKLAHLVAEKVDSELESILKDKNETQSEIVDFGEDIINNVLGQSTFGHKFQKGEESYENFRRMNKEFEEKLPNGLPSDIHPILGLIYFKLERDMKKEAVHFFKIVDTMFENAAVTWKSGSTRHFTDALLNAREQMLAEDRASAKYLTDGNLSQALFDIFAAGTGTSKAILGHSFLRLANDPILQGELRSEVISAIGNETCLSSDRIKMPKLDSFLQEIIRLIPPAPLALPRRSLDDVTVNGRHVPKNTFFFINLYAVARDTSIWGPDANEFKPERFLTATKDQLAKGAISFGIGARSCPGEKLAQADLFYTLARTLQKVKLSCLGGAGTADLSIIESVINTEPKRQQIVFTKI